MTAGPDHTPVEPLVLASSSPRRRVLLAILGVPADVRAANIDEAAVAADRAPAEGAEAVAVAKAQATPYDGRPILAADTIVVADNSVLGKPGDRSDAVAMLEQQSGTRIEIITAVALRFDESHIETRTAHTLVQVDELDAATIAAYVDTGEADDKAGALAMQGGAAAFTHIVEGSRSNTFGLPLAETAALLLRAGFEPAATALG